MSVIQYAINSLAWSGLGLIAGVALTEAGMDLRALISGRKWRDHP